MRLTLLVINAFALCKFKLYQSIHLDTRNLLANLVKSRDKRGEQWLSSLLVEVDNLLSSAGNTLGGKSELLVNLIIWSGCSP